MAMFNQNELESSHHRINCSPGGGRRLADGVVLVFCANGGGILSKIFDG
jgi:hypothetical protein